jgi:5'-nucleotidase
MTKILYVDMDSVLVDFNSAIDCLDVDTIQEYKDRLDEVPDIFSASEPMPEAIESFITLTNHFGAYILSTFSGENNSTTSDKLQWLKKYLGVFAHKRLILTDHKHLNLGDYLIDDVLSVAKANRTKIDPFIGEYINFGSETFPNWRSGLNYLLNS